MKHRWTALLLALCLFLSVLPVARASSSDVVFYDAIVEGGKQMFSTFEGRYSSVVKNDVGAVGMGIMGWRASKALELMKLICARSPAFARNTLGSALYQEVLDTPLWAKGVGVGWKNRIFNDEEAAAAKKLISSGVGIAAQNQLARKDITAQVGRGLEAGVRSDAALLYYCSAENHYGTGGVKGFMSSVRNALGLESTDLITSLDQFHSGAVAANVTTLAYRTKVYNYIKNTLRWDTTGAQNATMPTSHAICPSDGYIDAPERGGWAHEGVDFVLERGLFSGTSASVFSPNENMNRAMLVTVLYRMDESPAVNGENPFEDVPSNAYYTDPVIWASSHALINGVSEARFNPTKKITREQIATILFRFAQYKGVAGSLQEYELTGYRDIDQVSDFAYYAMIWATEHGLIRGDGGYLKPRDPATRAQVAAILMRYDHEFG